MGKPTPAMQAASVWYAKLASGENNEQAQHAWRAWLDADPAHRQAWQQLERVTQHFGQVPREVGMATLQLPPVTDRRQVIKHLALFLTFSATGLYAYRERPWRGMLADASTKVGEQTQLAMEDGTRLHLNTDTAVNVRYSSTERLIELVQGEIFIETAQEPTGNYRPFKVQTRHGEATALGTRFSVRDFSHKTKVAVFDGAVAIRPHYSTDSPQRIDAGESIEFTGRKFSEKLTVRATDMAWINGMIVVYAMRLEDFVQELARYKTGILRCDPAVANLKISGSFPIRDMESVLQTLERSLPVRAERFTRFWVTLVAT
ncbi:FecR domain-containing protein [Methylobacillus pratensis]